MSYTLLIVESPAKCSKIENYLGAGYKCIASFGHLRELNSLEAIDIKNNFKPTFVESEGKLKQISKIRNLIAKASEVLLASDDDREGEAIAWHICQLFSLPVTTTKRIIFHEITESALKNAVKNPTFINMDVVNAQIARQILDILVGYKLSPLLWKNIAKNTKTGLSAGRCQTPALRIVYDNQKEIDASPGSKVYNTVGYFTSKNLPFALNFNHEGEEAMTAFLEESVNHDHIYTCGKPRNTIKQPPVPFTTSGIQQMASNEMHISPKETMQICQKLYEAGHITYMRTDSLTYSEDFIKLASTFITSEYGKEYVNEKIETLSLRADANANANANANADANADANANAKKSKKEKEKEKEDNKPQAQEAHEAIRPTNIKLKTLNTLNTTDDFTSKELKMYLLIRRNTLESCMAPATYKGITAIVSSPVKEIEYRFPTEQVIFPGWKIVDGYDKLNNDYAYLQTLKSENKIDYKKITSKVTMKNIKSHYTEARLVQLLEQHGIGRPSTFSSLIDKIQERGYVKKDNVKGVTINCVDFELEGEELSEIETKREFGNEKNKLILQPLGMLVLEFLLKHFDSLFDYTYTKNMEDTLDLIAKGEKIWNDLCQECLTQIEELSAKILPKAKTSEQDELVGEIRIDNEHTYMIAKYGPVIKCTIKDTASRKDIISFKKLKPDIKIDINKLKNGEYQLSELVCENKLTGKMLGVYKDHEVILKNGKFGLYVEWGELKKSIKMESMKLDKHEDEITLDDILSLLENNTDNKGSLIQSSIVRVINDSLSIRSGKFGDYIFYKKKTMKQPKFLKLAGFEGNYKDGDLTVLKKWMKENYGV
jgi:DNA topoisomerase-1